MDGRSSVAESHTGNDSNSPSSCEDVFFEDRVQRIVGPCQGMCLNPYRTPKCYFISLQKNASPIALRKCIVGKEPPSPKICSDKSRRTKLTEVLNTSTEDVVQISFNATLIEWLVQAHMGFINLWLTKLYSFYKLNQLAAGMAEDEFYFASLDRSTLVVLQTILSAILYEYLNILSSLFVFLNYIVLMASETSQYMDTISSVLAIIQINIL